MSMCGGVSAPCHPALSKPLFERVGARLAKPRDVGKRLQAPTALLSHSLRVDRSLWSVGRGNVLLAATAIGGFRRLCDRISSAGLAHMKTKAIRTQGSANRRGQGNQQRWSARVMKTSNALDLEPGVFTQRSPRAIAASLKRSALASQRRKTEPFQSAMSMLNFHINRSGRGLAPERRRVLERAKVELRKLFGRAQ